MHFETPHPYARALAGALVATATAIALAAPVGAAPEQAVTDRLRPASVAASDAASDPMSDPASDPGAITCPIPTGSEFIDSWGAPRSGGRRHKGIDMIADRGTPIVAARAGDATFKRSRLGGNAVWLHTPTGDKFYYAHLDSFEGASRTVDAGEVIGYVGSSGNARGPHLHFETHVAGAAENPYPATTAACVDQPADSPAYAARRSDTASNIATDTPGAAAPRHRLR